MDDKSILIQSDEVTKNIMSEIQEDMINSLSKVSRNMSDEVIEKLKPIEKKINDLKVLFLLIDCKDEVINLIDVGYSLNELSHLQKINIVIGNNTAER